MAKSFDINSSSFVGELALPYVAPAILSANTLASGYIRVIENVRYKAVLKKLTGGTLRAATCDFTPTAGSMDLDEVVLTLTDLAIDEQICKDDFRQDWEAAQMGASYLNNNMPPNAQEFLLLHLAQTAAKAMEQNIWQGNYDADGTGGGSAIVSDFDGLLKLIVDASPSYETTVAGAFTADADGTTGILTHLDTLVGQAPVDIQGSEDTVIYMSRKSLYQLQRAMAGLAVTSGGYSPTFVGDNRPTQFLGHQIVVPAGMANDTLLMGQKDNFVFGTDLTSDIIEANVIDMSKTDASRNIRVSMRFSGGVQIVDHDSYSVVRRSS